MQSPEFPWLSKLPERDAHDFIIELGSALRGHGDDDYEDDASIRSWEQVLADVDKVIAKFRALAETQKKS